MCSAVLVQTNGCALVQPSMYARIRRFSGATGPTQPARPHRHGLHAAAHLQVDLEFLLAASQPLRRIVLERLQRSLIVCGPDMSELAAQRPTNPQSHRSLAEV